MKHVLILAHPDPHSFNRSVADVYRETAESAGSTVLLRDLYALGFDPLLKNTEIPRPDGFSPGADVVAERRLIADADVFVLIYPLWFYMPPAILVGYLDRVMGMGFGYGAIRSGSNEPLLTGKSLVSITSSGAPTDWVQKEGALQALKTLVDQHFAAVCGLTLLDHIHIGPIFPGSSRVAIERELRALRTRVSNLNGIKAAQGQLG
jgi:NAD(P)H dehydrogenase (quinone)